MTIAIVIMEEKRNKEWSQSNNKGIRNSNSSKCFSILWVLLFLKGLVYPEAY